MSADFDPAEFTDNYRAALQQVIDAKVGGREIVAPPEVEEAPSGAIDLMAALRASVERAKAARTGAPGRGARAGRAHADRLGQVGPQGAGEEHRRQEYGQGGRGQVG